MRCRGYVASPTGAMETGSCENPEERRHLLLGSGFLAGGGGGAGLSGQGNITTASIYCVVCLLHARWNAQHTSSPWLSMTLL